MGLLTAAEILAADDLTCEEVSVPEWGGSVRVRILSAQEMRALSRILGDEPDKSDIATGPLLVGACLIGEDNKPLFTADQLKVLGQKSNVPIIRLLKICKRLNCLGDAEEEAAKKSAT